MLFSEEDVSVCVHFAGCVWSELQPKQSQLALSAASWALSKLPGEIMALQRNQVRNTDPPWQSFLFKSPVAVTPK